MKKRIISLGLALMMSVTIMGGCSTGKGTEVLKSESAAEEKTESVSKDGYQYISAAETVKIAKKGTGHIVDVREWSGCEDGRVINSEWVPIFPLEEEELADKMADYAKENLKDGKNIYVLCYVGQKGAQKTTEVLTEAGIEPSLIYTVEGGAEALEKEKDALTNNRTEENIEWKYITGEEVLEIEDAQIVDVRDEKNYKKGHLEGSIHSDLTDIEDFKLQTAMYDTAIEKLDQDKPVYFLCYSGNKCAKTGISVLKDAGFDIDNLYIIKDGVKGTAIKEALIQD
jgi:rhodanese-related sulfurtransferase